MVAVAGLVMPLTCTCSGTASPGAIWGTPIFRLSAHMNGQTDGIRDHRAAGAREGQHSDDNDMNSGANDKRIAPPNENNRRNGISAILFDWRTIRRASCLRPN